MEVRTARASRRLAPAARHTGLGCGPALAVGAAVLAAIILAALLLFTLLPRGGSPAAAVVARQPGAFPWTSDQRTTLVLVSRQDGSDPPATAFTVLSYDPVVRSLSLLSVPANLWVTVPGFGQASLGEAYADGGLRLTLLTIQSVLGMPLPYYAIAGSHTEAQVIDDLGGATVMLPARMTLPGASDRRAVGPGSVRLSGTDTESFLAGAGGAAGQQVLLALLGQTQTPDNRIRLPSLLNSLGPSIATNFPLDLVPDLLRLLGAVPPDRVVGATIDSQSGTATDYTVGGRQLLLPRWDRIHALARRLLGNTRTPGSVDVLNGTDVPGQAAALADWLRSTGIAVRRYATAPAGNQAQTTVQLPAGASSPARTLAGTVAELLQAPIASRYLPSGSPVTVVIGRDFQSPEQR